MNVMSHIMMTKDVNQAHAKDKEGGDTCLTTQKNDTKSDSDCFQFEIMCFCIVSI